MNIFIGTFRTLPYEHPDTKEMGFQEFPYYLTKKELRASGDIPSFIRKSIGTTLGLLCLEHKMPKEMFTFETDPKVVTETNLPPAFNFAEPM